MKRLICRKDYGVLFPLLFPLKPPILHLSIKKGRKTLKDSIDLFPVLFRIYEESLFKQKSMWLQKNFNTQQFLLVMLDKWERSVDEL